MIILCNKCQAKYEFKEAWFKKNDPDKFVCRNCKIKIRTQSNTYKKSQSARSKAILSDPNIKERMSQQAVLSNAKNAEKISKSIKKYYDDHDNLNKLKKRSQSKWQDPLYRKMVSDGLQKRWQDPEYRGKVLGSRVHLNKKNNKLEKFLINEGHQYILGFILASYEFDALINNAYLYDEVYSKEKEMFVGHYFKNYKYINTLDLVLKPES